MKAKKKDFPKENVNIELNKQFVEKPFIKSIEQVEEVSKKVLKNKEITSPAIYEINHQLAIMQSRLFAENMSFYSKVMSCYSIKDMANLYRDYFGNIINCCLVESSKLNDLLFDTNNKLIQKTLNDVDS